MSVEVRDINIAHTPIGEIVWTLDGMRIPGLDAGYFIVGVARFFDDLFDRARGDLVPGANELERVSEALGYNYYAIYEITDGFSVWVKSCGNHGLVTLEQKHGGFRVSKLVPCETIRQIAVGLMELHERALADGMKLRAKLAQKTGTNGEALPPDVD